MSDTTAASRLLTRGALRERRHRGSHARGTVVQHLIKKTEAHQRLKGASVKPVCYPKTGLSCASTQVKPPPARFTYWVCPLKAIMLFPVGAVT